MPSSSFVLIKKGEIATILKAESHIGKRVLFLPSIKDAPTPFFIMEVGGVPVKEAGAEIHKAVNDLFLCLEGEIQFVCGGKLVDPVSQEGSENELRAKKLRGGTELTLNPGDWLFIPAGIAHKNGCVGTCRLMIVKIKEGGE